MFVTSFCYICHQQVMWTDALLSVTTSEAFDESYHSMCMSLSHGFKFGSRLWLFLVYRMFFVVYRTFFAVYWMFLVAYWTFLNSNLDSNHDSKTTFTIFSLYLHYLGI